jgi:hypothetical protein
VLFDITSMRLMPNLLSGFSIVLLSIALVKLSQPLLELKRSLVSNKGAPESLSTNTPSGVFLKISYCLQKRPSVPSLKAISKALE